MFTRRKDNQPDDDNARPGFLRRMRERLNRGDSWLTRDIADLIPAGKIDDDTLEELETRLLGADVGVEATEAVIERLRQRVTRSELRDLDALLAALRESLVEVLAPCEQPLTVDDADPPFVILMVGVNGAGKTTTIGKLARRFLDDGKRVMLAAGDTFRAAAVEQLQVWGQRNDVPVISQQPGADPAAVIYDALEAARARRIDVLIADTAGRLHTQGNLMDELRKVHRVMRRFDDALPHETMLVIDATFGQNALTQAQQFHDAIGLTGIAVTKLDGTAKGGVLFAIATRMGLPIRFIGIGEGAQDLGPFDAAAFVDALLADTQPTKTVT